MVAAVCVASVLAYPEVSSGWSILNVFPADLRETYGSNNAVYGGLNDRGVRMRSTFPHPILFGGAISMTIPLALYLLATVKRRSQKLFLYFSLVIMFYTIYKTTSRGPWLATGLALALLVVSSKGKLRRSILGLGLLAGFSLVANPGVADSLTRTVTLPRRTPTHNGSVLRPTRPSAIPNG